MSDIKLGSFKMTNENYGHFIDINVQANKLIFELNNINTDAVYCQKEEDFLLIFAKKQFYDQLIEIIKIDTSNNFFKTHFVEIRQLRKDLFADMLDVLDNKKKCVSEKSIIRYLSYKYLFSIYIANNFSKEYFSFLANCDFISPHSYFLKDKRLMELLTKNKFLDYIPQEENSTAIKDYFVRTQSTLDAIVEDEIHQLSLQFFFQVYLMLSEEEDYFIWCYHA